MEQSPGDLAGDAHQPYLICKHPHQQWSLAQFPALPRAEERQINRITMADLDQGLWRSRNRWELWQNQAGMQEQAG